ncbi:MAG: sulfurtransferase [Gammaproteobacteria bacterium]
MNFRSIISADIVQQHLHNAQWRIVDCRFNLNIPDEGFALYQMEHIPNAVYAHLDHDLSSPVTTNSGRHPLPEVEKFKQKLGNWGIDKNTQVVVYDDSAGSRTFLIDVRDPNRFHGIEEPIDKVAGHIPGAINFPWKNNITGDGLYQPKALLHDQYKKIICETPGDNIVFMCGSGVTACHSLLALEYIGISGAKLYPGSWSEWISNPDRPVEPSPKLA